MEYSRDQPISDTATTLEKDWLEDVNSIIHSNDDMKPYIAKLMFDKTSSPDILHSKLAFKKFQLLDEKDDRV